MGTLSVLNASDGLRRIVAAELLRQQFDAEGEGTKAAQLVRVTGFHERVLERYPGTSSYWTEDYVDIYWVDDAEAFQVYEWRGDAASLDAALERLVEDY